MIALIPLSWVNMVTLIAISSLWRWRFLFIEKRLPDLAPLPVLLWVAAWMTVTSLMTSGSSAGAARRRDMICVASSSLSCLTSQRGDSGSKGVRDRRTMMKRSGRAMVNLQLTDPVVWYMPKLTHDAMKNPLSANAPSIRTKRPRFSALAVSLTYMGTVPVYIPIPTPRHD